MRLFRIVSLMLIVLLVSIPVGALTIVETSVTNIQVILSQNPVTKGINIMLQADVLNGVRGVNPRHVQLDITSQLTANQLNSATTAYNFILNKFVSVEGVPAPAPIPTSTP